MARCVRRSAERRFSSNCPQSVSYCQLPVCDEAPTRISESASGDRGVENGTVPHPKQSDSRRRFGSLPPVCAEFTRRDRCGQLPDARTCCFGIQSCGTGERTTSSKHHTDEPAKK